MILFSVTCKAFFC